jgi:predicted amidohydrolase
MSRILNVGVIQMPVTTDTQANLDYISTMVDELMSNFHRPELVIGVEYGCGLEPQTIPGRVTDFFCEIAKKYGIYFIPCSIAETHPDLPEGKTYNAAPVINPQGEIISVYRKICPFYPVEENVVPGREYVVFDIPEKDTKVGLMICYDAYFPEISRNLTLMGAEVLVKITLDQEPLYRGYKSLCAIRAIENQVYFVCTNAVGISHGSTWYGHSSVIDPEAKVLWEAEKTPEACTVTLDLDKVRTVREYGAFYLDQTIKHLAYFNPPMPYAGRIGDAPLYQKLNPPANTVAEFEDKIKQLMLPKKSI